MYVCNALPYLIEVHKPGSATSIYPVEPKVETDSFQTVPIAVICRGLFVFIDKIGIFCIYFWYFNNIE